MTIKGLAFGLVGMVAGWLGVLVAVGLLSDAAPAQVVVAPSARFMATLPEGVAIMDRGALSVTLESEAPNLALRLYAAGARLVLPAGLPGCLPLPKTTAAPDSP